MKHYRPVHMCALGYSLLSKTFFVQEADAIISSLIPTIDRIQKLDFTTFIQWNEPYSLIVPRPSYESRLLAFIRPFQPLVSHNAVEP